MFINMSFSYKYGYICYTTIYTSYFHLNFLRNFGNLPRIAYLFALFNITSVSI